MTMKLVLSALALLGIAACAPMGSGTTDTAGGHGYEAPPTGSLLTGGNHDSLSDGNLDAGMSQHTNGTSSH